MSLVYSRSKNYRQIELFSLAIIIIIILLTDWLKNIEFFQTFFSENTLCSELEKLMIIQLQIIMQ